MSEAALRAFGAATVILTVIIVMTANIVLPYMLPLPIGALLVVWWINASETSWADINYVIPPSWIAPIVAFVGGVALKLLLKTIVMPLLGAPAVNPAYHFLAHNNAQLPLAIVTMCVAGFAEETVFRGYLFERLGSLHVTRAATVVITTMLFALAHYSGQGLPGVEQAIITGAVFGTIVATRRSIVEAMCAHAAFDLTALAMIYFDAERAFAHVLR